MKSTDEFTKLLNSYTIVAIVTGLIAGILFMLLLILLTSCQKSSPDPAFCWDCWYHADPKKDKPTWVFCDKTQYQIDSLKDVFGYDCPDDSLKCTKQFNLNIEP
jgi:hypothetical protein